MSVFAERSITGLISEAGLFTNWWSTYGKSLNPCAAHHRAHTYYNLFRPAPTHILHFDDRQMGSCGWCRGEMSVNVCLCVRCASLVGRDRYAELYPIYYLRPKSPHHVSLLFFYICVMRICFYSVPSKGEAVCNNIKYLVSWSLCCNGHWLLFPSHTNPDVLPRQATSK